MATPPMTRVREGPGFRETWYQSPDGADTEYTREEATPAYCEYIRTTRHRPLHRRYATPTRLSSPPPRSPTATPSPAVGRESCSRLKLEFDSPGAGPNGVGTGVREAGHSPRGRDAAGAGAIGAATSALPVSGGPPGVEGPTPGVSAQSHAAAAPLDTTADSRTQTEVDLLCPGLPSSATTRVRPDVAERLLARATAALQRSRARAAEAEGMSFAASPPPLLHFNEGALATVRAQCKLWVYLGTLPVIITTIKRPPGKNKNHPEAFTVLSPFRCLNGVAVSGTA